MLKNKLPLIIFAALLIAGGVWGAARAAANFTDDIVLNQVYDCGPDRLSFKVLSCRGTGDGDTCEVYNINPNAPGGGFSRNVYRNVIRAEIGRGCSVNGVAKASKPEPKDGAGQLPAGDSRKAPSTGNTNSEVGCSASSEDSQGRTSNEKTFRGVIRRLWEKEAAAGSDGAVTLTFESMVVGAPRSWRANASDAYGQVDPKKPIYPVRASFSTCTDYRTAISTRKMERIYDCFVHKAGGWQCTQTGASGALALKDKKEYIPKKR